MVVKRGMESDYAAYVATNSEDGYSKCCVDIGEAWADEMEAELAKGRTVAECAQSTFSAVDRRPEFGITGFMYGATVAGLSRFWQHGEALRRWHNVDLSPEQGASANEREGAVLNPAVLTFSPEAPQ